MLEKTFINLSNAAYKLIEGSGLADGTVFDQETAMIIELDNDVFDALIKEGAYQDSNNEYVTATRGKSNKSITLLIPVSAVKDAVSFVVTDNEGGTDGESDPVEIGALRCDTLAEAVNAMVHGVEGQKEVTFYCELCADYGSVIEGVASWCHPDRYGDGTRWEDIF